MSLFFPRPNEEFIFVEKKKEEGFCPRCNGENIRKYPVLNAKGWYEVKKCQDCLYKLDETEMPIWGYWKPLTAEWINKPDS